MKASNALLAAWFVVIAGLVFAIVLFSMKGCSEPAPGGTTKAPVVTPAGKSPTGAHPQPPRPPRPRPTPEPAKPLIVQGIVRGGSDNQPVAGAHAGLFPPGRQGPPAAHTAIPADIKWLYSVFDQIVAEEWDLPRPLATWTAAEIDPSQSEKEIAGADTGPDGKFTITIPPRSGQPPWRLRVSKQDVGHATMSEVRPGGPPLELTLGAASLVKGTVITEIGSNAVEGARVVFDDGARRYSAVTDGSGGFTVEGMIPGFYQLSVAAKGRTPLFDNRFRIAPNDPSPLTLRMPQGALLRITAVVEKLTNPAPGSKGAEVQTGPLAGVQLAAYSEETYTYVFATTNAAGVAEFPGMPAGNYHVNGRGTGVVSLGGTEVRIDRNDPLKEDTVTFEQAVDTPLEVVDEDGRPIAGFEFYTGNGDEKYDALRSVSVGKTDTQGKLKFPFEEAGTRCAIFGFKKGYGLVRASPDDYQSGDPVRLVAKKPLRVHGTVKTPEGKGIADAVVAITVTLPEADAMDIELEIRTDANGRYDFEYLPRGDDISMTATAPDGISEEDADLELVPGQTEYQKDIVIDLEPAKAPPAPAPGPAPPRRPK